MNKQSVLNQEYFKIDKAGKIYRYHNLIEINKPAEGENRLLLDEMYFKIGASFSKSPELINSYVWDIWKEFSADSSNQKNFNLLILNSQKDENNRSFIVDLKVFCQFYDSLEKISYKYYSGEMCMPIINFPLREEAVKNIIVYNIQQYYFDLNINSNSDEAITPYPDEQDLCDEMYIRIIQATCNYPGIVNSPVWILYKEFLNDSINCTRMKFLEDHVEDNSYDGAMRNLHVKLACHKSLAEIAKKYL